MGTETKENQKEVGLLPIKDSERTGDGNLLPEVRERVLADVEAYITKTGDINISEIARQLSITWDFANTIVGEIAEGWRVRGKRELQSQKLLIYGLMKKFVQQILNKEGDVNRSDLRDLSSIMKELDSLDTLENKSIDSATEASKMASIHFNNINLPPSMLAEMGKVLNQTKVEETKIKDE
jgi:hypothetical protein